MATPTPTGDVAGSGPRLLDMDALTALAYLTGRRALYWGVLLLSTGLAFTMAVLAPIARTGSGRLLLIVIGVIAGSTSLVLPELRKRRDVKSLTGDRDEDRDLRIRAEKDAADLQVSLDLEHQLAVDIKTRFNVAMRDQLTPDIADVQALMAASPARRGTDCGALYQKLISTVVVLAGVPQARGTFYAIERTGSRNGGQTLTRKAWTGRGDEPRRSISRRGPAIERRIWDFIEEKDERSQESHNVHQGPYSGQYAGKRYRSLLALKVMAHDGKCLGMLAIDCPDADAFLEGQLDTLFPMAELFGIVQMLMSNGDATLSPAVSQVVPVELGQ